MLSLGRRIRERRFGLGYRIADRWLRRGRTGRGSALVLS